MCSIISEMSQEKYEQSLSNISIDTFSSRPILSIVDFDMLVFAINCFLLISLSISSFQSGLYVKDKITTPLYYRKYTIKVW